ncbi:MAG TPA: trypsin-like peptidase domain-containing protein [Planctomycetaceae bacterium]|nr:trypsin-like peptidase domain-containing protein [Planctomycetaceae bacterium]
MKFWLGCLCSAVLGGLFACYLQDAARSPSLVEAQDRPLQGPALRPQVGPAREPAVPPQAQPAYDADPFGVDGLTPEEAVNVSVYERVNKSVVNITTKSVKAEGLFSIESSAEGAGSGSVLDTHGHILTNNHVIEDAREVSVTLHNGKSYDATFVGADAINDIAIIKIDAPAEVLFPVSLGDSAGLKVGMRVFAIGNPFGLERTLTTGIISSLNRSLTIHGNRTIKSIIQIDAAINPGNSGGPLMDAHGLLIGMNTAIASRTGQSAGVGFAIPVNLISRIVPQLVKKGHIVRPEVGISRVYQTEEGLQIALLTPGGPAERAGLRGPQMARKRRGPFVIERLDRSLADLIIEVDGKSAKTADEFLGLIERHEPGEEVIVTVIRDKRELRIPVRLGSSEESSRRAEKR